VGGALRARQHLGASCDNQLLELRRYAEARGWTVHREYVDHGVSGAKDKRPALDALVADAKRRRSTCWCAGGWTGSGAISGTS
jgi:DNA invertase Pin-like site-specific DNA recombinase